LRPGRNDCRAPRFLQDDAKGAERRIGIGDTANEGDATEAKLKEMSKSKSKSKSVRAMKLPRVASKIMERSYQRSGVVAGGTLLSSGARQARGLPAGEADRRPHFGSSLEDFLEAEGLLEEATEHAIKAVVAWQLRTSMERQHLTKAALARQLHTSRSQIDRVLDPNNEDVSVSTLRKAAEAVGQKLKLELVAA
jgi:antitoxin HicB